MISILENIKCSKNSSKIAIALCDHNNILEKKTFKDILQISEKFEKTFHTLISDVHLCMGLIMEKNIYLPSIILCLQKLNNAFVYLAKENLNENILNLNLKYILSLNIDNVLSFEKISEIIVDNKTFVLWKKLMKCPTLYLYEDIFCIVQSSGTTSTNKTIRIPYNCIENNAQSLGNVFKIKSNDVIFWGTPLSFDPSLIELLMGLMNEATLIIVPHSTYINPKNLFSALFDIVHVTIVQMVPSIFYRWDDMYIEKVLSNSKLRILGLGGETFPKDVLKFNRKKDLVLFNVYGITEVSCWATVYQINEETVDDEVPIGQCLENTIVEVRDENGDIIDHGTGQIYIGSNTRKCYIDDETEISLPKFRETGDIGYIINSNIYYKGRKNRIIKRYGHRINLSKIEETVTKLHLTSKCVWCESNKKLLIFILLKNNYKKRMKEKILEKIRIKILNILPQEYFPDYFEILQTFPTTLHGKINERRLEEYYLMNISSTNFNISDLFCNLWCKYLGVDINNLEHIKKYSFFEMGGNSINILQLISEFKDLTNIDCADLVTGIFEKKLYECKNLIANKSCYRFTNKRISESTSTEFSVKIQKINGIQLKVLWKYDLKACVDGSPLVFTDSLHNVRIAAGSFCNIFAILGQNGNEIFKNILTGSVESTPTISPCKKLIYIGCYDGTMHCINYCEKQTIWTFKASDKIKTSVLILEVGNRIVFGSYDKYVYCLSTQSGLIIWKTEVDGNISANFLYHKEFGVLVTTTHGTCYCISDTKGDIIWKFNCLTPIFGTPCIFLSNESIIVPSVNGILFCLSLKTGKLLWKFKANGHIFSSVVKFENYIIFGCHDKHIYVLKISVSDFVVVGKVPLHGEISSSPCVYKKNNFVGILAATNIGTIFLINLENLSVIEKIKLPGEVFSSPVIHENKAYVGCRDNNLYCLSLE